MPNRGKRQARGGQERRREASGEFIANNGVSENVNFVFMASNVWAAYADCCHKVDFKFCLPLCLSLLSLSVLCAGSNNFVYFVRDF